MAGTQEHEAAIWKKLHAQREEHIEQARRARDMQANFAIAEQVIEELYDEVRELRREVAIHRL